MAKKRLATGYTFDASAQTIVHADFSDITLAGIQLITNVTDQIIIYNFADTTKGGTLATDTLTLEYDTTSMSDTDELMILVEDGVAAQSVTGTVTANLSATDNAVLDAIEVDTSAIAAALYTEGDTDASITGNAVLWEGLGNTLKTASHETPLPVDAHFDPGSVDSFGHFITGAINNQVDIQFYRGNGTVGDLVTETSGAGGGAAATGGMATFSATTSADSFAKGVTTTTTVYTAGAELYTLFTAGWTGTGAGTSFQRIGLYDDNNGFYISKEANSFGHINQ